MSIEYAPHEELSGGVSAVQVPNLAAPKHKEETEWQGEVDKQSQQTLLLANSWLEKSTKFGLLTIHADSGKILYANNKSKSLLCASIDCDPNSPPSFFEIVKPKTESEFLRTTLEEFGEIDDFHVSISPEKNVWISVSAQRNQHLIHAIIYDISERKNLDVQREELLLNIMRQQEELNNSKLKIEKAFSEIQDQHSKLLDQSIVVEQTNVELEIALREHEYANTQLEAKKSELEATLHELKNMQTQLIHSERMSAVGSLTAGIMHEINNPNGAIFAALHDANNTIMQFEKEFLALLKPELIESTPVRKLRAIIDELFITLKIALEGSERVKHIVEALTGFSTNQNEGYEHYSINEIVLSVCRLFGFQYRDVELQLDLGAHNASILCNHVEIHQVILNLLVNAAEANATKITLKTATVQSGIEVVISDDGFGVDEEVLPKVFEPFFTTKSVGNSGMGLTIVQRILDSHEAQFVFTSTKNQGSEFKIIFFDSDI